MRREHRHKPITAGGNGDPDTPAYDPSKMLPRNMLELPIYREWKASQARWKEGKVSKEQANKQNKLRGKKGGRPTIAEQAALRKRADDWIQERHLPFTSAVCAVALGITTSSAYSQIARWLRRGLIKKTKNDDGNFAKFKYVKAGVKL